MVLDEKWQHRFMDLARFVSRWSKDPSTKCGSVIVGPTRQQVAYGYNGFPIGVQDTDERYLDRKKKYNLVVHAELNAILNATFNVSGCTLFCWPIPPCPECTKAIIQSGISYVCCVREPTQRPVGSTYSKDPHPDTALMFSESLLEWILLENYPV